MPVRVRPVRRPVTIGGSTLAGYRCAACGETFDRYTRAERHVDQAHAGGRIEVVFDISIPPPS